MSASTAPRHRPIGVTLLAAFAAVAGILAGIHTLQAIGILPVTIGGISFRTFNFWYALMFGLLTYIYFWLVQMLWRVNPSAWLFFVIITIWNLTIGFIALLGDSTWQDINVSMIINGLILLYMMLPWVRNAFIPQQQ